MRIIINRYFQNGTLRIKPGEYDIDDPLLRNMGGYLLAEGYATRVKTIEPDIIDYESMTKDELTALIGDDIEQVEGTGAGGNVLKSDLVRYLQG